MAVRIITDTAADLTEDEAAEHGVGVVPLTIRFGAEEFVDRRDLTPSAFYARLAATQTLPETAAPAPGAFEAAFRHAFDNGADAVVCICISSGLSGTMQSAAAAARLLPEADVRVLDSHSITWGLGSQVVAAATAAKAGASADEVVALVEAMVPRTRVYGALDTLDNLRKSGRIGGASAFLGTLLSVKPTIDISTGVVEQGARLRTRARALRWLVDKVSSAGAVENLAVVHARASDVEDLMAQLRPLTTEPIHVAEIGATIGTHGGPGVIGVAFQVPATAGGGAD